MEKEALLKICDRIDFKDALDDQGIFSLEIQTQKQWGSMDEIEKEKLKTMVILIEKMIKYGVQKKLYVRYLPLLDWSCAQGICELDLPDTEYQKITSDL